MKKLGTILISVSVLLTLLVPMFVVPASAATTKVPSYYRAVDWDTRFALGDNPHDYAGFSQNNSTNVIIDTPEGYKMRTSWSADGGYGPKIYFEKPNNEATGLGADFDYDSFEGVMIRMTVPSSSTVSYDYGFAPILEDAGSSDIRFSLSHFGDSYALPGETHVYLYDYATGKEVKNVQTHTAGSVWDTRYVPYNSGAGFDGWVFFPKEFFVTSGPTLYDVDGATIYGVQLRLRGMYLANGPCIVEFGDIDLVYNKDAYVKEVIASNYPAPEINNGYYCAQDFSSYTVGVQKSDAAEGVVVNTSFKYYGAAVEIIETANGGKALKQTATADNQGIGFPLTKQATLLGSDFVANNELQAIAMRANVTADAGWHAWQGYVQTSEQAYNTWTPMAMNIHPINNKPQSTFGDLQTSTFYLMTDAGELQTFTFDRDGGQWAHEFFGEYSTGFDGWYIFPIESIPNLSNDDEIVMFRSDGRNGGGNQITTVYEVGYVYDLDKFMDSLMAPETSEPIDNESAGILDMEVLPNDKQGLRFTHTLETVNTGNGNVYVADGETYTVKTIGSLVAIADYLETSGKALNLGNAATDKKIMSAAAESYRSVVKDGDKRTYKFTSLIKNIGKANKAVDVSARAFVICEDAEGNEKIFYGPVITKNVQQVYDAAVVGGHEFNAAVDSWMA